MNDVRFFAHLIRRRLPDTSLPGLLRTFPASILLVSVIVLCGLMTWGQSITQYRPVLKTFGLDYEIISDARIWHLVTPLFIQPAPGIGWKMILLVVVACTSCELLAGGVRLIVTFFLSDWCASILTSFVLSILSRLDFARATDAIHITDAGTSAAAVGSLAAAITLILPPRLAAFSFVGLVIATVAIMDVDEFGPAVVHIAAICVGGAIGRWLWRPQIYTMARREGFSRMAGMLELRDAPRAQ